ncbi:MAG: uracil-DNA glycosylase family protein [Solirubrobacterales bacterium]
MLTGIPWILPGGQLSDKGRLLDRELLRPVGHTADPADHSRQYAHLTDVSHLWLGRTAAGKLRRPTTADKLHSASWLEREIQAVRPKVVLLLGRHAAPFFLKRYGGASVSRLDDVLAQPMTCNVSGFRTTALATLHPTGAQMARGGAVRAYRSTVEALIDLVGA